MDASRIRKKKIAFSQISGYVWTGPKKQQSATVPKDVYCYRYCFLETKERMHNEVETCVEILPTVFSFFFFYNQQNTIYRFTDQNT